MGSTALVLFSGGQDSTVCLVWSLQRYARVETIGFSYGQRHEVEMTCRMNVREALLDHFPAFRPRLGPDHLVDLSAIGSIGETALTRDVEIRMQDDGIPNTFVPGRNLMFLAAAGAVAYRRGLDVLVGGMCETDYSGYPDCRDDTIKAMQVALNLGMNRRMVVETPLMWVNKAQTWEMAQAMGGTELVDIIVEKTHTCYIGERTVRHPWGYGCARCPACQLREQGYLAWREQRGASGTIGAAGSGRPL